MDRSWTITAAALTSMVAVPLVFETFTFYLYTSSEPSYFTFSGARLWVFLAAEIVFGFVAGLRANLRPIVMSGTVAAANAVLLSLLYQFCDERQCYYSGPDGFAAARVGALLFSTATVGVMVGSIARPVRLNTPESILFVGSTVIFLGYFPWALLFAGYMTMSLGIAVLAFAGSLPFLLSGMATRFFSSRLRYSFYSATAGWSLLSLMFSTLRPDSVPLVLIILPSAIAASLAGFALLPAVLAKAGKYAQGLILAAPLAIFAIGAAHPFTDGAMNLSLSPDDELLPQPTYYSAAYHISDKYFSTKRVEVEIDLARLDLEHVNDSIFAGIAAQSPNCCKDGLDYGYRADLLFNNTGTYLVARAWEACDYNIACSGFPWISTMHQSIKSLEEKSDSVMLAMEWKDESTASWFYKAGRDEWTEYSSFQSPDIENAYFNLGVINVGNPISNPDTGNAYFYQAGVSSSQQDLAAGIVTFRCPAYYDAQGIRHCAELEPISRGNSHWKAYWKWGIQGDEIVATKESEITLKLE